MFESRRKANAERRTAQTVAVVLALFALFLLFLGTRTSYLLYYAAFLLFIIAGVAFVSGTGARGPTWSIGAEGEETVARHLSLFEKPYHVIHDVVLPEMRGNIDHIVLGPNGVFVVETKNHNGLITCNGDSWTQRKVGQLGTPYLGNIGCPSKQVKRYAVLIRNLIRERLGISLYVNCVIVFTNTNAVLHINNPAVAVLKPRELCEFIKTYPSEVALESQRLEELETIIRPYSQFR